MDGGRNKHHHQWTGRRNLKGGGRFSHDESQGPEPVAGKWEGDDCPLAEPGAKVQDIRHAFQRQIDAAYERDLFKPLFEPPNYSFADHMSSYCPDRYHEYNERSQT
jgi:hypothetical protein